MKKHRLPLAALAWALVTVALCAGIAGLVGCAGAAGSGDGPSASSASGSASSGDEGSGSKASGDAAATASSNDAQLKTLRIGSDNYPPYVYDDENGEPVGVDVDILTEALSRIGYRPEFHFIDWEKKAELLDSGEYDAVMCCFTMTGREDDYRWAGPYMKSRQVVAVDPASDIQTLADLEGKVVAVQSTTKPESLLLDAAANSLPQVRELYSFADRSYIYPSLVKGYVDAIAAHETSILTYEKDYGVTYRILPEPLLEVGLGCAFSKKDDRGIDAQLDQAFKDMAADGTMEQILGRYFDDPAPFLDLGGLDD